MKIGWRTRHSGGACVRFAFSGPDDATVAEDWLAAQVFGAESYFGPTKFEIQRDRDPRCWTTSSRRPRKWIPRAAFAALRGKDATHSGEQERGQEGRAGRSRAPGRDRRLLAQRPAGQFRPLCLVGEDPKNPMLELRVYLPGSKEPIRQIAFARLPFLNLDGIHGRELPGEVLVPSSAVPPNRASSSCSSRRQAVLPRGQRRQVSSRGDWSRKGTGWRWPEDSRSSWSGILRSARAGRALFEPVEIGPGESGPDAAAEVEVDRRRKDRAALAQTARRELRLAADRHPAKARSR